MVSSLVLLRSGKPAVNKDLLPFTELNSTLKGELKEIVEISSRNECGNLIVPRPYSTTIYIANPNSKKVITTLWNMYQKGIIHKNVLQSPRSSEEENLYAYNIKDFGEEPQCLLSEGTLKDNLGFLQSILDRGLESNPAYKQIYHTRRYNLPSGGSYTISFGTETLEAYRGIYRANRKGVIPLEKILEH